MPDLAATMTEHWERHWPGCRPIGSELRNAASETWVRFHSLPGSRRIPAGDADWAELLRRHHLVLAELSGSPALGTRSEVRVITPAFSTGPTVVDRDPRLVAALPAAEFWTSVLTERFDDGDESWTHLFVSQVAATPSNLDPLLRLVADDVTAEVIIADTDLRWLYHPYDGGADVIAATVAERDVLRDKYSDWLSARPDGL